MSSLPPHEQEDDLLGIYEQQPEHSQPPVLKNEFKGWHHPRKHYVRLNQWCKEIKFLLKDLGLEKNESFRYLTLPGDELLDVRTLHKVFEDAEIKLRYLGFNSVGHRTPAQAELHISRAEVQSLGWIDRFSLMREERLENLSVEESAAYNETSHRGPFDAINLDLCNSITQKDADATGSHMAALEKLLKLQMARSKPWLLFITTFVSHDTIAVRNRRGFDSAISSNLQASSEFRSEIAQLLNCNEADVAEKIEQVWGTNGADLVRLFCTGIGKWLLSLLANHQPPRELNLSSAFYYQTGHLGPDMLSLALRVDPIAPELSDPHGILSAVSSRPPMVSEVVSAVRLAKKIREDAKSLDELLAGDDALGEKLITKSGKIMATARFSEGDYTNWAREKLITGKTAYSVASA